MNCLYADCAKYQELLDRDHAIEMIEEDILQDYDSDPECFYIALNAGLEFTGMQDRVNEIKLELFRCFDNKKLIDLVKELKEVNSQAVNCYIHRLAVAKYESEE